LLSNRSLEGCISCVCFL